MGAQASKTDIKYIETMRKMDAKSAATEEGKMLRMRLITPDEYDMLVKMKQEDPNKYIETMKNMRAQIAKRKLPIRPPHAPPTVKPPITVKPPVTKPTLKIDSTSYVCSPVQYDDKNEIPMADD